jgi:predicted dehydrogenase
VIGSGWMAMAHLRAYSARSDVRIVGLVSRSAERAAALARQFRIDAVFDYVETMLCAARPDGVSITTVEHEHTQPSCLALGRGIGVLVEKPLATTVEDAEIIADAARRSNALLVPAHVLRFAAPHKALRQEVATGRLGSIVAISARRDRTRSIAEAYARVHPALLTAVHDIDQVLWLTGDRVVRVRTLQSQRPGRPQPDLVWAQLELASGVIASVGTAMLHPSEGGVATSDRLEVYGTEGVAAIDLTEPILAVYTQPPTQIDWLLEPFDGGGAFGAEIAHFLTCLRTGRASDVVSVDDAIDGIRVATAMIRSAEGGGTIVEP